MDGSTFDRHPIAAVNDAPLSDDGDMNGGHLPMDHRVTIDRSNLLPVEMSQFETLLGSLTARQLATLQLLARGLLNKEIAWEMGVSLATAKVHVSQVIRKLRARSRTAAAVCYALLLDRRARTASGAAE